jgi:hypothetical protein
VPNRWPSLLALGEALFGRLGWWPPAPADAGSAIIGALAGRTRDIAGRPAERPSRFADAGITLLRTAPGWSPEIWCRCGGGPHGFLSIAVHAHADALSVEVRCGGVTSRRSGDYASRRARVAVHFRSTIAHNTAEFGGQSQSGDGGPSSGCHANGRTRVADLGDVASWTASTTVTPRCGNCRTPAVRSVDRASRSIDIVDEIRQARRRLACLGPDVRAEPDGPARSCAGRARRRPGGAVGAAARCGGACTEARVTRSSGWYSSGLGRRVPASRCWVAGARRYESLSTRLSLSTIKTAPEPVYRVGRIWAESDGPSQLTGDKRGIHAEAG